MRWGQVIPTQAGVTQRNIKQNYDAGGKPIEEGALNPDGKKYKPIDAFQDMNEDYKLEIIDDLGVSTVGIYTQGEFTDLCRGTHLPSTGYLKAFKLMSTAGAYWRGDSNKKMLQRIYGVAFPTKKELDDYLVMMEEAEKIACSRFLSSTLNSFFITQSPYHA